MTTGHRRVDTAVIGAGPAGAAAATTLARAGQAVELIDKAKFPRDKFCGDGLTTLALRELEDLGFDPASVASWTPIGGAVLRSPRGARIEIPLPDGGGTYAAIARRHEFDAAMVELAAASGACCTLGNALVGLRIDSHEVLLELADGSHVGAASIVAADGMWSPTRRLLGLDVPGYRGEWHAFRQYFADVGPAAAGELWVWFESDLLPGYFWSFPSGNGSANVGFGILRGGTLPIRRMKTLWPELLARPHIADVLGPDARPEAPHRAWPIPARIDSVPLTGPRTLFVGDAAAACDVLTGEGIGQALVTARLAAEALIGRPASFAAAAESYENGVRSELVADHRMAKALSRLMAHPRVAEVALRAVSASRWSRLNFGRWMFEDYPRALPATPRRWRRGALSAPGAFDRTSEPNH